jgi:hypothetical protein
MGLSDHHEPLPGDNGIRFKQIPGLENLTDQYRQYTMSEEGISWLELLAEDFVEHPEGT